MVRLNSVLLVVLALTLAACGRSGRQEAPPAGDLDALQASNPLLPKKADKVRAKVAADTGGVAIASITKLEVDPTTAGAIIMVEGLAERQGAYDARLIPLPQDESQKGVLSYALKVYYPRQTTPVGSEATRKVIVAQSVSAQQLANVRLIRVTGAQNAREVRRR